MLLRLRRCAEVIRVQCARHILSQPTHRSTCRRKGGPSETLRLGELLSPGVPAKSVILVRTP